MPCPFFVRLIDNLKKNPNRLWGTVTLHYDILSSHGSTPNFSMSTFPFSKTTPSFSNSIFCFLYLAVFGRKEIFPCALMTRCHGTPELCGRLCNAYPTRRCCPGSPVKLATSAYDATLPLGICFTVSQIR